jgi:nitronate monooxygenase
MQAPMAFAAGGKLAASVSRAGGLGMIGGAYGNGQWIEEQFAAAGSENVGCGFITWSLLKQPELLEQTLALKPAALFLSFGDPEPLVGIIKNASVPVMCQVQTLRDAKHAVDLGVDIIIAQGSEAGGHGEARSTVTLVPEVADYLACKAPNVLLCAAGGIADGRGLAAAIMLGADGVLVGSRFWATKEALVHPNMLQAAIEATGDDTLRTSIVDIVRQLNWPSRYSARVIKNSFSEKWHADAAGLNAELSREKIKWHDALSRGDHKTANVLLGEAVGLIHTICPAKEVVTSMANEAEKLLNKRY